MPVRHRLALEPLEGRITPVSFGSPYGYDLAGSNGRVVALGDVDNDGDLDLAVGSFVGGTDVKLNNGSGVFTQSANVNVGDPRSVALADMDGDNKLDLVFANGGGFQVVIVRGNGDGTFANTVTKNLGAGALSAFVADLNQDGRPDVGVASGDRVLVLLNDGTAGILGNATPYITNTDTYGGTVGDLNDDGRLDIILSGYSTDRFDVLLNAGGGTFGPKTSYALPGHGGAVAAGDLDGDGRDDLAVTLRDAAGLLLYTSNADGTLRTPTTFTPPSGNADGAVLVDMDLDGDLDVVSRSFGISRAIVWPGNGDGTVNPAVLANTALNASDLAVGDVNGDQLPDLATSATTSPSNVTITPNTTPANAPPVITSNGGGPTAAVSVAENGTAVTTVTATDPTTPPQTLTYTISGGADAARFTINATTGALAFVTAPNFEAPTDAGGNNVYDVIVRASDGAGGFDTQALAVTVTDVFEQPPAAPPAATAPATQPPPYYSGVLMIGTLMVLQGSGVPGGTAFLSLPPGSMGLFTDVNGDGRGDVVMVLPNLIVVLDGQTGRFLTLVTDLNGDRATDVMTFNADGTTSILDGRTGRRI